MIPHQDGQLLLSGNNKEFYIYNLNTQKTTFLGQTNNDHNDGNIISLSARVFIFGNGSSITTVEEYFASNNTWVEVISDQLAAKKNMVAISVPASWFQWLPQMCHGL